MWRASWTFMRSLFGLCEEPFWIMLPALMAFGAYRVKGFMPLCQMPKPAQTGLVSYRFSSFQH